MQGPCDSKGRFLEVSIGHPGSTSDYFVFGKLEKPGFLDPVLVLHGDNACVSNEFVVAPFENSSFGSKDACNFYQSQDRIRVQFSFGILVQRWEILRKPISQNFTLRKIIALICSL